MKPIKLKNGKWRIRPMINGRQMCFTFDYRPTKAEIDKIITENTSETYTGKSERMKNCIEMYIESKDSVLSPATIKAYRNYLCFLLQYRTISIPKVYRESSMQVRPRSLILPCGKSRESA